MHILICWTLIWNNSTSVQYSLVNIVWGTASTGSYGGTVFSGGVRYSLVNNVCGVWYSLGYRIHSDTGSHVRRESFAPMTPALRQKAFPRPAPLCSLCGPANSFSVSILCQLLKICQSSPDSDKTNAQFHMEHTNTGQPIFLYRWKLTIHTAKKE